MKQHHRLLLGLALGIVLGSILHPYASDTWIAGINENLFHPIGQIFLRLIFMVVVPLVFSALVLGVMELGQGDGLGRIAAKTLGFTVVASAASVVIGITLVNVLKPGAGFQINPETVAQQSGSVLTIQKNASSASSFSQAIIDLFPKNPIESAAQALNGQMLQLMIFALIFGLALSSLEKKKKGSTSALTTFFEQLFAVTMKVIDFAMKLAPYGVFAIVFNTVFKHGYGILGSVFYFVIVVVVGLLIQQFGVYSILLTVFARRSPIEFFSKCREVLLYAFSTASSNATLPLSLETAEMKLKLPPRISRFVLTVGATANQNGTALFEGVTVLFLAQVYGIDLSVAQQMQVVFMSILAGIGTAGIPGGSLPMIMILLQQVGIPPEGMGLILGADRFLDMCRTTLNVSGDLVIAAVVSGGEKK